MEQDLLLITNLKNELIYQYCAADKEDKKTQLLLLAYASLDIFKEVRAEQTQYFYYSIDKFMYHNVSLLLMPSGYKIVFVHEWKDRDWVFGLLKTIHSIFLKVSSFL